MELRQIFVWRADGFWQNVRLAEVKKGEKFKYTEDGVTYTHVAASDGRWCDMEGNQTIQSLLEKRNAIITIDETLVTSGLLENSNEGKEELPSK